MEDTKNSKMEPLCETLWILDKFKSKHASANFMGKIRKSIDARVGWCGEARILDRNLENFNSGVESHSIRLVHSSATTSFLGRGVQRNMSINSG